MTIQAAHKVQDTGISPVTSWEDPVSKKIVNFIVPGNQDMSSGFVHAVPSEHSKLMIASARENHIAKPARHYDALKQFTPAPKPGQVSALSLQARGMQHQEKMHMQARPNRNRYDALRAAPSAPKPAPKPQSMPAPMPQNKILSIGEIAARKPEEVAKNSNLRLASSQPKKPASLAQRMSYWSAGLACNIG